MAVKYFSVTKKGALTPLNKIRPKFVYAWTVELTIQSDDGGETLAREIEKELRRTGEHVVGNPHELSYEFPTREMADMWRAKISALVMKRNIRLQDITPAGDEVSALIKTDTAGGSYIRTTKYRTRKLDI